MVRVDHRTHKAKYLLNIEMVNRLDFSEFTVQSTCRSIPLDSLKLQYFLALKASDILAPWIEDKPCPAAYSHNALCCSFPVAVLPVQSLMPISVSQ